jgi:amino acid adenylation domain-containing protein
MRAATGLPGVRRAMRWHMMHWRFSDYPGAGGRNGRITDAIVFEGNIVTVQQPAAPADTVITAPVSPAQRGLWLINELHPDSSLYNVFLSVSLTGPVDLSALHAAVQRVVARHEALRTTFVSENGVPVQRIADRLDIPLPVTDLESVPAADRSRRAGELAQAWCESPFDLAAGPLLRTGVFRLGEREHLLCLALHHIVCDGQSVTVLFEELAECYALECGAQPRAAVPELTAQYRDYVAWQHARTSGGDLLPWWRAYLAGAPDVLTVPADRPRPTVRGIAGATRLFDLPAPLMAEVAALARRMRMSPFMVLLGAYAALLGRLGGTADLLVGMPVTDRPEEEFEPLIGLFVDTLPVRVGLSADRTFETMLEGVRRSVLDVLSHQGVAFDRLVDELRPDRLPSHTPLVQVAFSADLAPMARPRFAGLDVELSVPEPTTAKFDLDMSINAAPGGRDGCVGVLTYSTELFDPATIDRFVDRFTRFLRAGVERPQVPLHELPLLEDRERATILGEWSEAAPARAADDPVHEMFARQAAATPQAPAVSWRGTEVSYAELDDASERVAEHLRAAGAGPDDIVGVLQERGVGMVATLLGILKSGAAYLPLSSTHPPAYLAGLLEAAGSRHAVADAVTAHRLAGADVTVLTVEELIAEPRAARVPARRVAPDNLAYVLFTSGSTGEPKGVAIAHRSVSNIAATMREMYHLTAADRVLQFANIGFDIAVEELFPAWSVGACVVLAPEPPPGPEDMTELMTRERVTFTILTSSYWRQWVTDAHARGRHPAPSLRLASIGAEPVDAQALRVWQRDTGLPVFNAYGLTETTVNATVTLLDDPFTGDRVPIGRPIDGVQVYVLDDGLSPVPVGMPGQLYVGGDCLARGYLGRPDLTADRFVPHPFSSVPGARLHRTGDRARWLPGGGLEVLGRLDGQLKLRGYRIEPGHIEAALCSHPLVDDAAVVVRPAPGGQERLIGYVVPAGGGPVPADLRDHLAGRLPAYMVPAALVAIAAIPLNANGKADPRALPEPAESVIAAVPARNDLERVLAGIWQEALGLPEVGVHDNFFERGGTSLSLARVLARLNEESGTRLPLVALYEFPTIASLARHLTARQEPAEPDALLDRRAERLRAGRSRQAARRRDSRG